MWGPSVSDCAEATVPGSNCENGISHTTVHESEKSEWKSKVHTSALL